MEIRSRLQEALRVNRLGVLYFFSLEGGSIGVFMAYLVCIQEKLNLNDNDLGTSVFCFYLGEMIGTPAVAAALRGLGVKRSTYGGSLIFSSMLVIVSFADSYLSLCLLFLLFGLAECALDVSMNALAVLVEVVAGYPICGSFHGSYSVSAAVGGAIGGVLVASSYIQLHVMAVLGAFTFMISSFFGIAMYTREDEMYIEQRQRVFNDEDTEDVRSTTTSSIDDRVAVIGDMDTSGHHVDDVAYNYLQENDLDSEKSRGVSMHDVTKSEEQSEKKGLNSISGVGDYRNTAKESNRELSPSWLELLMLPKSSDMAALAALSFLASFGESALTTWIIFFFQREFDVGDSGALTTLGFSLFEVFMGLGRYLVDTLRAQIGSNRMVFYEGCCTMLGMTLIVSSPSMGSKLDSASLPFVVACLGCSLTGFGLSTLIPISYISAGYCEGHGPTNISIVATWAGAGCIASSPIVGGLSTALGSLRLSLVFLAISLAPMCCLAGFLPRDRYTLDAEGNASKNKRKGVTMRKSDEDLAEPLII